MAMEVTQRNRERLTETGYQDHLRTVTRGEFGYDQITASRTTTPAGGSSA